MVLSHPREFLSFAKSLTRGGGERGREGRSGSSIFHTCTTRLLDTFSLANLLHENLNSTFSFHAWRRQGSEAPRITIIPEGRAVLEGRLMVIQWRVTYLLPPQGRASRLSSVLRLLSCQTYALVLNYALSLLFCCLSEVYVDYFFGDKSFGCVMYSCFCL